MNTMKYEESKVMKELHAIREKHYEETKHMTDEDYINYVNERARKIAEKYNMKFNFVEKH